MTKTFIKYFLLHLILNYNTVKYHDKNDVLFFSNKKKKSTNIHCVIYYTFILYREHDFHGVFLQFLVQHNIISPLLFNVTVKWVMTIKYYFWRLRSQVHVSLTVTD